jgi:UDP-N-acetylmuramoylalanine--D-glutamate ligase
VRHFKGLPHRLQIVHEEKGVRYVNDSIATIPEAAVAALEAFEPGKVIQIVGGYDKHLDMSAMCQTLGRGAKAVLCMGATGPALAKGIQEAPGRVAQLHECGDLATAMALAKKLASAGDVILLSTGCASYDQFVNFEQRGEEFVRLARQS